MKTAHVSGFGISTKYEKCCQRLLWRGVAYLEKMKPPREAVEKPEHDPAFFDEFEKEMLKGENDVTGAMMGASAWHARYIYLFGREKWLEKAAKNNVEIFDYAP